MTMPHGAILKKRRDRPVTPEPAPRHKNGRLVGRPRGDDAILAVFKGAEWLTLREIARRTSTSYTATAMAVYRARLRGLIERDHPFGAYRPVQTP